MFGAEFFKVIEVANLGSDEAAFEVGVDGTGGLWRGGAFLNSPGATLFLAGGEEGLEA